MPLTSYNIPSTWNKETYKEFKNNLYKLQDITYNEFNKKTIYTNYEMIGIRVPILREIGKSIKNTNIEEFLNTIDITTHEEVVLEGIALSYIKDYDTFIKYFNIFINHVDNWATCDMTISKLKIIDKNKDKFLTIIEKLLNSNKEYLIRIGVISLFSHYIEDKYIDYIFDKINNINNDCYYVEMAIAWLVCELFIKKRDKTYNFIKNNNLSKFTQNKAISKIRDSYRVTKEDKEELLKYKRVD